MKRKIVKKKKKFKIKKIHWKTMNTNGTEKIIFKITLISLKNYIVLQDDY